MKHAHEFRDPIHTFITVRSDERDVINSRPFQRLRHIHQLALTYLLYPGATHKRFEHSLGVMELATRIFDVVTRPDNVVHPSVWEIIPDDDALRYWRGVLRMAALCHDIGHLPFSHAAEAELLPSGYDHERITVDLIRSEEMAGIWSNMTPPLRADDIVKIAVGRKKSPKELSFSPWEAVLSEIIIGDALGADRMDYLIRDSYHAGVQYGRFDHNRLINTIRILPQQEKQTEEPALGLEAGGLESSEGLVIARYFIYSQMYFHHVRRAYDIHLVDFLKSWLPGGVFPIDAAKHLEFTDVEVIAAIRECANDRNSDGFVHASRIDHRDHFRRLYSFDPGDREGGFLHPAERLFELAKEQFSDSLLRYDSVPPKNIAPDFPVLKFDGTINSSLSLSGVLPQIPQNQVEAIYCSNEILDDARKWLAENKNEALQLNTQGRLI